MYSRKVFAFFLVLLCLPASSGWAGQGGALPTFTDPTAITNPFLPLGLLKQDILEGTENDSDVRIERSFRADSKTFKVGDQMVQTLIVEDRVFRKGKLLEVALDYFAQGDDGVVYYLGEDVDIYNKKGKVVSHEGAWLFGVNTNQLGVIMPANPKVGDKFQSENVPGITREDDEVISLSETVTVPSGTFSNCLKIKEVLSDGEIEYKYYAPGVGVVKEVPAEGEVNLRIHAACSSR